METNLKKILRSICIEIRHCLEGCYDSNGNWVPGDLENRLASLGIWPDRDFIAASKLPALLEQDIKARRIVEAYVAFRKEAGTSQKEAVREFIRESAYTWVNRLLILRCMESRCLIDEVILQKESYGWRSLKHNRLAKKSPEVVSGADEGLFQLLNEEVQVQSNILPSLFDPDSPAAQLRPSIGALKYCISLLSGRETVRGQEPASDAVFSAPDALGWAYQYWNSEAKERVFENLRTKKGAKIEGADIIPATQLYTEPYIVKFLVQNSLGAQWMLTHPQSKLADSWEYFVRDADRAPSSAKTIEEITFLDPAVGSGHFLLEAFDLFYAMYEEEGACGSPKDICASILNRNLFGIDIDERAVQITQAVLWMKAKEKASDLEPEDLTEFSTHLVATNIRLPKGKNHLEAFLKNHPEDKALTGALETVFEALENVHELGTLAKIEEPVGQELQKLQAAYEKAKKEKKQDELFSEFEKPVQGELPVGVETYGAWKGRTISRLKNHFLKESETAEFSQAFFSRSAAKGLMLFDLLSRKYDVVAANPPYMGSKNMGAFPKKYVDHHYKPGKRDLYASFILRCLELTNEGGRVAMVTQQSWMFLRSFAELRAVPEEKLADLPRDGFRGLLRDSTLETLAHLGAGAFTEISGEVVNSTMFVFSKAIPKSEHRLTAFRLIGLKGPEEKKRLLMLGISDKKEQLVSYPSQHRFLALPDQPLCYWLRPRFFEILESNALETVADICQGLRTTDNSRFLRYQFEISDRGKRWFNYSKGGRYQKWTGLEWFVVDFGHDGQAIKELVARKYPYLKGKWEWVIGSRSFYFLPGLSYSCNCRGSLGLRILPPEAIFDPKGPGIFPKSIPSMALMGALSSRLVSYCLRAICPGLDFNPGYVAKAPIPDNTSWDNLTNLVKAAIALKGMLINNDLIERSFTLSSVNTLFGAAILHTIEGQIENAVIEAFQLQSDDVDAMMREVGMPVGSYPLIIGFDRLPTNGETEIHFNENILKKFELHKRVHVDAGEMEKIKNRVQTAFEVETAGAEESDTTNVKDEDYDDLENDDTVGDYIPIPTETALESVAHDVMIHPISVYWIIKEGIEKEGWRCLPEERRIMADQITVIVLRLLGHRWPKQIEAGEPVPEWADEDGIIPLTPDSGEKTLIQSVRERIAEEFKGGDVNAIEREFRELMGMSLEEWLETEFFKRHISQFKKRPIAWQIQSTPTNGTGRGRSSRKPAFSCFLYYHSFGHARSGKRQSDQVIPNIRSQYVGPLKSRYATELNNLEKTTTRTADQDARRVELELKIRELEEFDQKLEKLSNEGFDFEGLKAILQEEAIDEWARRDESESVPGSLEAFYHQERRYDPDINDGVRVNSAPLQKFGLLACDVLAKKDIEKAIQDRAEWRADERRWCREGKLPRPGWWKQKAEAEVAK